MGSGEEVEVFRGTWWQGPPSKPQGGNREGDAEGRGKQICELTNRNRIAGKAAMQTLRRLDVRLRLRIVVRHVEGSQDSDHCQSPAVESLSHPQIDTARLHRDDLSDDRHPHWGAPELRWFDFGRVFQPALWYQFPPCSLQFLQAGDPCSKRKQANLIIARSMHFLIGNLPVGRRSCRPAKTSSAH